MPNFGPAASSFSLNARPPRWASAPSTHSFFSSPSFFPPLPTPHRHSLYLSLPHYYQLVAHTMYPNPVSRAVIHRQPLQQLQLQPHTHSRHSPPPLDNQYRASFPLLIPQTRHRYAAETNLHVFSSIWLTILFRLVHLWFQILTPPGPQLMPKQNPRFVQIYAVSDTVVLCHHHAELRGTLF